MRGLHIWGFIVGSCLAVAGCSAAETGGDDLPLEDPPAKDEPASDDVGSNEPTPGGSAPTGSLPPAPSPQVQTKRIAAGERFTCVVQTSGGIKCWGAGSRLGAGEIASSATAISVKNITNAVAVSVGNTHACARTSVGDVYCWGSNQNAKVSGKLTPSGSSINVTEPVLVSLVKDVVDVAAGMDHTCVVLRSGAARCWGANGEGQLGTSSAGDVYNLSGDDVTGLSAGVKEIGAGPFHTCALMQTGTVKCWGRNDRGQLGIAASTRSLVPVDVPGLTNVTAIAVGAGTSCALLADGTEKCWGSNLSGALGNGNETSTHLPQTVTTGVLALAPGNDYGCAAKKDGSAACWGAKRAYMAGANFGELGNGTATGSLVPVAVKNLNGVLAIATSNSHSCALLDADVVKCWGSSIEGQLGNGVLATAVAVGTTVPVDVLGL